MSAVSSSASIRADIVAHHLRIFGFPSASASDGGLPFVSDRPGGNDVIEVQRALAGGAPVVAILPSREFASAFGVVAADPSEQAPSLFRCVLPASTRLQRLR